MMFGLVVSAGVVLGMALMLAESMGWCGPQAKPRTRPIDASCTK